eukprot:4962987-Alexandrium_andersonii.AAC.1
MGETHGADRLALALESGPAKNGQSRSRHAPLRSRAGDGRGAYAPRLQHVPGQTRQGHPI